jgi:PAS domain S-box-containing protein
VSDTTSGLIREAQIPAAPLESILCKEAIDSRPSRVPDYERENRALIKLMSALADSPGTIFQALADTILEITDCDSAGLSLLTKDGKTPSVEGDRFYWPAIAGMWNPHVGGGTPRNFGPCGDVLDRDATMLFTRWDLRYPYLGAAVPLAEEGLLVPFYVDGKAVGTIWGILHSGRRKFDAEDNRLMASLGKFASSAYQAQKHIEKLKIEVDQRKKAEAEVRRLASGLEAKIRCLVEANVVGIVMWHLDGLVTEANDAFLRMVQYDRHDLEAGRICWKSLTPREWLGVNDQAARDLKEKGAFQPCEKEYLRKDGSRVPILITGALFEPDGTDGVAFVLDLSEQKRAQTELAAELTAMTRLHALGTRLLEISEFQPLLEEVLDAAMALQGADFGNIQLFNPETEALEIVAQRGFQENFLEYFRNVRGAGAACGRAMRLRQRVIIEDVEADPGFAPHRDIAAASGFRAVQSTPLFNRSGQFLGMLSTHFRQPHVPLPRELRLTDLCAAHAAEIMDQQRLDEARRQAEHALDRAQAELAHATRVMTLGTMTASIAHELHQPLCGMVINASTCQRMLGKNPPNIDAALETARRTIRDANRASAVISRLRALFGKNGAVTESVNLNEAVLEVMALSSMEFEKNRILLLSDLADDLPPVTADRVQLQQVVLNLLRNGSEAMSTVEDRPRKLLISTARDSDNRVRLTVQDSGVGFDPQAAERLFDPFYTTKGSGMGIGLSVSRSIIEHHHGRLWATLNDGPGAAFSFSIPRAAQQPPAAEDIIGIHLGSEGRALSIQ